MIDVVSVFCRRDLALQLLQARSIARYFERSALGRLLFVWNDTREMPEALRGELTDCVNGVPFELRPAAELGIERASIAVDGWTTQQALKLLAARHVTTDRYLVLDAKNHFLRPCAVDDFVAPDGRGILPMQDLSDSESFRYCLDYFGVAPETDAMRGALNTTPFVLEAAVVDRMLAALFRKEGQGAAETFLAHQHRLSEFLAYQAYVLSEGGQLSELFSEATASIGQVVWGSTARDGVEFERCMTALEGGSAKVGGLHWMACCIMSARQRARMCGLWRDRELVESTEQGQKIFDSVTRGLREGDKRYLDTYLRSVGARPLTAPAVSVIVPVYNQASYLADCLGSILAQSLRSLEVICVDDASIDGSGDILERIAGSDARVTVVRRDRNGGPGVARNAGLALARGEFVQFTDADDLLTPDALRLLLEKARTDRVDVVRGGVVGFHTDTAGSQEALDIPEQRSRIRPLDHEGYWVPWWHSTYLYSRQFLLSHGISYPELRSGEDPVFLARVLTRVPLISAISAVTYRYRLEPLENKGRTTYRHVRDYLRQAEMVRDLFLTMRPDAWHRGFAPLLLPEIQSMVRDWQMTSPEREMADAEMARIFELPRPDTRSSRSRRRLLFMYNVCGLGGVEASIINKMEALRPLGIEVRALFQGLWGDGGRLAAGHSGFVVEAEVEAQRQFIRDWSPDAIVVIDSPWLIDVVSGAGVQCPILFETHLSDPKALERRVLAGASDQRISAVIAPSVFNRTVLAEHGIDPARVRVIPNPIDFGRFRPDPDTNILTRLGLPNDCRPLLFVGRLEPAKNPLEFMRISAALARSDPDIHSVVVGDAVDTGETADSVRAEAASLAGRITFIPRVLPEEMPPLYSAVARSGGCLVSTSVHESQPMIMLEAMACGCPVVASDVGGVQEIMANGRTGCLYRAGDVQGAVAAVLRLMNERDYRDAVVSAAMDYVHASHTLARAAEAYLVVLDEVGALSSRGAPNDQARPDAHAGDLVEATHTPSLARNLVRLFSEKVLVGVRRTVVPYHDVVPRVQLGFEPAATVELEMRPKDDFSRSPDQCLNTLVLDYQGPSRWLTIESAFPWTELMGVEQYQVGMYARPDRPLRCRVVLRIPDGEAAFKDFPLCELALSPEGRSAHGRGRLGLPTSVVPDERRPPKLLLFLDAGTNLHLELDYLTAYLA